MLSKKSKAIGFIIMSAFGFAMMAAFIRLAGDLPFTQKTFFRNLVAVAVAAVVLCREKVGFKWEKGNLPLLIIRATCGTLGITLLTILYWQMQTFLIKCRRFSLSSFRSFC